MTRYSQWTGLGLLLLIGCAPKVETTSTAPKELPTVTVTTAPLESRTIQRVVSVVGTLHGYEEMTIAPKVDGRVVMIRSDVGDVVRPGAVLLELEDTDYRLDLAASSRALEAELARLGLQQLPKLEFDPESVPLVRRAEVSFANAKTEFQRAKELAQKNVNSKREYESAEMEYRVAEAMKRDAVSQAQAVIASAKHRQAILEQAEQRLTDTKLRAPIPYGWDAWSAVIGPAANPLKYHIAAKLLSEGEMVRSMPVSNAFRLVIDHMLKLKVAVPERYSAEVKVGMKVLITVDAFADKVFQGEITRVNPTVDVATRTFQVEVSVANLAGQLKAGSFARASIQTRLEPNVKIVPNQAVINFAGVSKVFVDQEGKAKTVQVTIGTRSGDWVEVIGDLKPGQSIITSGQTQLVEGSPLQLKK